MLSGLAKPTADVAPPTKLSRKARRALSRTELAAASPESPYALTSDQVHTPDDQDIQTPPNETANKSPYVEVIQKKMRALRKKLTKLDKYDQLPTSELNADQIQALDKKPEIVAAFKELEDAVKQIAIVEAEEAKALLAKQHAAEEQAQNRIQNALNKAQQAHASESRKTIQLFHVLNVVLPKLTLARAHIGENEYNAVFYFRALVTGVGLEPIESPADFFNQADSYLKKYLARSEDLFVDGFTYAQLADAVDALLNPPAAPKFGGDFAAEAAVPETTSFFSNDQAEEAEENVARDGDESASKAPSFGTISFFNPSEVLGTL
ncbi:hypothetical protein DFJ77DRAFT_469682 [Powellomyces hirtus]|nr:hypothetical protein DFJ77DRAFT_469682 [Powellomyces hirtus]